jgi:hypothetical protein
MTDERGQSLRFHLADRLYKSPPACKANLSLEACREIVADLLDALDDAMHATREDQADDR